MSGSLPLDNALPHLGRAWNANVMRDVFASGLRTRDGAPVRIHDCRIERFRYRAATRAIVLYELALDPAPPRHMANERGHAWVTATMYADGRARSLYQKTLRSLEAAKRVAPNDGLMPIAYIEEMDMFVQIFPLDRYLPALQELAVSLPAEIEAAMLARFGNGHWHTTEVAIGTVRYRPFQGMTLRYDVAAHEPTSGRNAARQFYAKTYRDDAGRQTHDLLGRIAIQWQQDGLGLLTPRPVGYFERLKTLVVDAACGTPVDALLAGGADPAEVGSRCADAVLRLHSSSVPLRASFGRREMLERATAATEFLTWALPSATPAANTVVAAIAAADECGQPCTCHLDLKPDHIFLDATDATFIDLDTLGSADPALDVAALFARLESPADTHANAGQVANAFLSAYFADAPAERRYGFPTAYAYTLLQLALFALRHQQPDWPTKVTALVERAADAVRDRSDLMARHLGGA